MECVSKTDIGMVRKTNQDAVKFNKINDEFAWSVVCDGMGGANGGDIASAIAVNEIENYIKLNIKEDTDENKFEEIMRSAVNKANFEIFAKASKNKSLSNMGTTIVLCIVKKSNLHIIYAGDSRVYLIKPTEIPQISKDHSVVQEMVDMGEITQQDAKNHPQKNIITRALGVTKNIEPDYIKINISENDIILSCTDGLTNSINDDLILKICTSCEPCLAIEKLIKESNLKGGKDNITACIIKV